MVTNVSFDSGVPVKNEIVCPSMPILTFSGLSTTSYVHSSVVGSSLDKVSSVVQSP
jgi:hypothetical protein